MIYLESMFGRVFQRQLKSKDTIKYFIDEARNGAFFWGS